MNGAPGLQAKSAAPFPWDDVLAFGFCELRLPPDAVWSLTPVEIAAILKARRGPVIAAPRLTDLSALLKAFPDGDS